MNMDTLTYKAMKLNASAAYFRLHTVSLFQRWTRQLTWLKFSARKMNEVSHLRTVRIIFFTCLAMRVSCVMLTGKISLCRLPVEEERAIYVDWRCSLCLE